MSEVDEILDNMKFRNIMKDNMVNNPWLFNYELGSASIPEEHGGGEGTVFSTHGQLPGEKEWTVMPTIMENEQGNLQYFDDWKERGLEKGYGVKFSSEQEAEDFSKWLSKYHERIGQTQSNYEL